MGNTQAGEKQHKTAKSPGKGKHFIRNLNKRGSGKESKKHTRKKSNVKLETPDREFDKTSESDNNETIEASDNDTLECVFKTSGRREGGAARASVQSEVTVTRCEAQRAEPRRSPTRDQLPAASADPSTSDSVFTDPLTPLAVELNQCYYSAESDSAQEELPRTLTPTQLDAPAQLKPRHSDDRSPIANMPHDDIIPSLTYETVEKEVKIDVFDDKQCDMVENEKNMGALFTHSRADPLSNNSNECEHDFLDNRLKSSPGQTSFTLSRHRKVELPPVVTEESLHILDDEKDRPHSNVGETITESNVLRKVASLTLERHSETKVVRPKFVPEKLDFQLYEKFEGQMLLNWFVSSVSEGNYFKKLLNPQDLKVLGIQYCTHLLAAGVLRQITDKDAPKENTFKPNLMYYWAHMEEPVSQPVTPGKLDMSSWPPDRIYQPHKKYEQITNKSNIDSDYFNKNNYEEISDIYTANTTILELKCKIQELQNQLDYFKNNLKTGTINESLNSSQTFKQENKLDIVKIDLVNKEVQTSLNSDVLINRLMLNSELCTSKNGDSEKECDIVLNKLNKEIKSERRSDKIENYCKLNKSREYNKSHKKDGISDIGNNNEVSQKTYDGQRVKNLNTTCESSSEASFLSTTDLIINDNTVCWNILHDKKLIDDDNVTNYNDVPSSTTNEQLILNSSLSTSEIPVFASSVGEKKSSSESSFELNKTCKRDKNGGNDRSDNLRKFEVQKSSIISDTNSSLLMESLSSQIQQDISKKQSHETSDTLSISELRSSALNETSLESPTKGETVPKSQKFTTLSPQFLGMEPLLSSMSSGTPTTPSMAGLGPPSSPVPGTRIPSPISTSEIGQPPPSMPEMSPSPSPVPGMGLTTPPMPETGLLPPPMPGMGPTPPPMPGMGPTPLPMSGMGPPPPPMPEMGPLSPPMPGMGPPPPPMSGMGPPPPPMEGMGPPPPPMPGMVPPPPPMEGMGPPPPPMPGMGPPPPPLPGIGPPPPPMPGMGPLPPPMPGVGPAPPPMPGMGLPAPTMSGVGPPPPPLPGSVPPPPPPQLPGAPQITSVPPSGTGQSQNVGPAPFPTPPVGGWGMQRATLRKTPIKPAAPMKPLYWTRILAVPPAPVCQIETDTPHKPLWLEIEEANLDNIDEFTDLFSRQVVKAPVKKIEKQMKTKIQPIKILDSKRSQNVGILAQSLHVEFSEIENAIYNFDTSVVSLEALQQIYELRASEEELSMIKEHLNNKPDVPLDKPESFLHDLSGIKNFAERISCFTFQAEFDDAANTIMHKLDNLKHTCEFLTTSESLKHLFAIILTLGNYMNGGNCQRGQADGFGLEILSKLKDVKSKQSTVTLLHFIVKTYMRARGGALDGACALPVPEPGDVVRAAALDFADVETNLATLRKQLDDCKVKVKKVIDCEELTKLSEEGGAGENTRSLEVFKEKMTTFLNSAEEKLKTENDNLNECRNKFIATVKFYQYSPKCGKVDDCEPKEFFSLWTSFCSDFKDIYKKEEQIAIKEKLKETKKLQCERKAHTQPKKEGGLKARLQKLASTRK